MRQNATETLLAVDSLETQFRTEDGTVTAVDEVSFSLKQGEVMGIVGESGAGKSVTAKSIMRLIQEPGEIVSGTVTFDGQDLLSLSDREMRSVRGNKITLIPQDPMTSLNPVLTVGEQIVETIQVHQDVDKAAARDIAIDAMAEVGIPDPASRIDEYPHEFSGGMRQRVLIAIGLSCEPDLIIADEPTTALDVTTQAKILELLNDLRDERGVSILMITHNLGVVAQTCDHVGVMYAGNLVETGTVAEIFDRPRHPYTRALLDAIPKVEGSRDRLYSLGGSMPDLHSLPDGCNFADRCPHAVDDCRVGGDPALESVGPGSATTKAACIRADELDLSEPATVDSESVTNDRSSQGEPLLEVSDLKKYFPAGDGILGNLTLERTDDGRPTLSRQYVKAVDGVGFTVNRGETVGLVGESGCGKSTVARTVLQLLEPTDGEVYFDGQPLHELGSKEIRSLRQEMQIIFQDPKSSLNPRKTIGQIIGRGMKKHDIASGNEARERIRSLLERVGLSANDIDKYPHQFSGGQQQRIAIANALAVEPDLIVCDEPVSALDVSVQAQILNLLDDIQDEYGLSYLFISHNISVVKHLCDRVAVMYLGKIAEMGPVDRIFQPPYHPYTESLLSAVPHTDPGRETERILLEGTVPSPINPPTGCPFHTRCPKKLDGECERVQPVPESVDGAPDHVISCHLSVEEMNEPVGVEPPEPSTPGEP
ncbi:ABC transporter ATP-binding protein [Natrarchaeobaculum sulfurireducens]|uniref:Nickel import system ATP-binding protein NikD n=1 Tax=Natrarchaeobaculum sulfurireducens TaxID=2044521 RepID=A0A346PK99_9EURY|nr:ABC transporter ATP-binding protein [Natrarchaeobaculum sulfurireducens]AXR79944.1 ABC-type dipeptide/oligopeptide/nickel transport system, ATPase component [Natrarchaeobaculum sulfurireducens]